ncbi:LacI family DNA-binding transcriptional regulator [Gilvimarinus sp. SDUM040013]|uniref:LacI family DNA-binding transcriptional regulator n=1 Tax=Gilvimarinus gilvus TaxID=3058038 RepID=A0ABU4S6E6_9GAMM|nr:LacI family DNA-binding transcriptional regulator [Gilvimarinus sp. SDUM040013]MDO3385337.1 LacI family DNA-binding transcriptional regulator [Gilvimarinus sp. SDUM040013]MDX6851478.1 LacI family DNA-binding transcriptional regulator [Gilvimarinus sp. SDUM040013]
MTRPRTTKSKKVTMKDVASMAGVSIMTVSRVLNNDKVSDQTYDRVMEAVKKLNYRLNVSARSLSGSQSYLLGFFYDNSLGSYISQYLIGVLKRCNELGYHLVLEPCSFGEENVETIISELSSRYMLDGVIVPPPLSEYLPLLDALDAASIRYVRVGPGLELDRSAYVSIDDYQATFEMTEHLINEGHRHIGFIKGDSHQGVAANRFRGFSEALLKHGIAIEDAVVAEGDFNFTGGMKASEEILDSGRKVTAIFASNDDMASAVIATVHKRGLRVPEDIAVAGFDDTSIARSIWPQLTTVKQPIDDMSADSVDLLIEAIKADQILGIKLNKREILPHSIIVRNSTRPVT